MMGVYFQKSLKRATALALIFAVSSPVSATHVTWSSKGGINEDDSFATIASRDITLSIRDGGIHDDREGANQNEQRRETISYSRAVDAAQNDLQAVKRSVIASDLLSYPQSYDAHKEAFQNLITQVYRNTQLGNCQGNPLEEISVKLFKVSQKHLSKSKERLEWVPDDTLGAFFTFTNNKDEKVSILIKDLNAVLPLYMENRRSHLDSLAPYGVDLTPDQRITGQFINRILSGEIPGDPLKRGIQYRLQNQTGLSLEELVNRFTGRNLPLRIGENNQITINRGAFNRDFLKYKLLPSIRRLVNYFGYDSYENFVTNDVIGLKLGANNKVIGLMPDVSIHDYIHRWKAGWSQVASKIDWPSYDLPGYLMVREEFDRNFLSQKLLPALYDKIKWRGYASYENFMADSILGLKPAVTNQVIGLRSDATIQDYIDQWKAKYTKNVAPSTLNWPSYDLPTSLMFREEFDKNFLKTKLLPAIRQSVNYVGYDSYENFVTNDVIGLKPGQKNKAIGIQPHITIPDYIKKWKSGWVVAASKIDWPVYELPSHLQ